MPSRTREGPAVTSLRLLRAPGLVPGSSSTPSERDGSHPADGCPRARLDTTEARVLDQLVTRGGRQQPQAQARVAPRQRNGSGQGPTHTLHLKAAHLLDLPFLSGQAHGADGRHDSGRAAGMCHLERAEELQVELLVVTAAQRLWGGCRGMWREGGHRRQVVAHSLCDIQQAATKRRDSRTPPILES